MGKQIPMPCFSYGRNENAGNLFLTSHGPINWHCRRNFEQILEETKKKMNQL